MFTDDHKLTIMGLHPRETKPPYREIIGWEIQSKWITCKGVIAAADRLGGAGFIVSVLVC